MEIQIEQTGHRCSFYIEEVGERLAEMTFNLVGTDKMIIEHTEANNKLRDTGTGAKLVAEAVCHNRQNI